MKPTGSIYLHCDQKASHYLKVMMDTVFGLNGFRNQIVWRRTLSKGLMTRRLARNHDILLSYQLSDDGRLYRLDVKSAKGLEIELVTVKDLLLGTSELVAPVLNRQVLELPSPRPRDARPTAEELVESDQHSEEVA